MGAANPIEGVVGPLDDVETMELELRGEGEDEKQTKGEDEGDDAEEGKDKQLVYGSCRDKVDDPAMATKNEAHCRNWIRSELHIVEYDNTNTDKVFFISCSLLRLSVFSFLL